MRHFMRDMTLAANPQKEHMPKYIGISVLVAAYLAHGFMMEAMLKVKRGILKQVTALLADWRA